MLRAGVQGITDIISTPGLINLDFADVKSVMQGAGSALMGIGSSRGADRAIKAAELAVASPLLEASIEGARGVLLSIQGGSNLGMFEINDAAKLVQDSVHPEANIIFGTVIDDTLGDEVRVTVIAAGFDGGEPTHREFPNKAFGSAEAAPAAPGTEPISVMNGFTPAASNTGAFTFDSEVRDPFAEIPAPAGASYTSIPIEAGLAEDDSDLDIPDFMKN